MATSAAPGTPIDRSADVKRWITITQRGSLAAFLLTLGLIGYNTFQVVSLNRQVAGKQRAVATLDQQISQDRAKLAELERSYAKALGLANATNKDNPAWEDIKPRARAVPVKGLNSSDGSPIYDFSLWLETPAALREQIAQVTYQFDHPTFHNKGQIADDPSNGFQVGYRGWGALRLVTIEINLRNGKSHRIYFDMLKALGWDQQS